MLDQGHTQTSIAEMYGVSRPAVRMALSRAGEEPETVRHNDLLPWRVRSEHLLQYAARMLRVEGRVRRGLPVPDSAMRKLEGWKRALKDQGDAVILYLPNHDCPYCDGVGGFHPMRRRDARSKYGAPARGFDTKLIFVTRAQGEAIRTGGGGGATSR